MTPGAFLYGRERAQLSADQIFGWLELQRVNKHSKRDAMGAKR